MFNLEKEISGWLRKFRRHRAFNDASIREMELHLRDHIDDLMASGKTERDAFNLAVQEFGDVKDVAQQELQTIRPSVTYTTLFQKGMLGNYLKVAVRNFTNKPFFTFLNTFGLAIGIAGTILIGLFIYDELRFDTMFADADRIYRINVENRSGGEESLYASAPGPMAAVLKEDCSQVESVMRFREVDEALIRKPDATLNIKEKRIAAADSSFFTMFGLTLLKGNSQTALDEPNSIVLTESAAHRYFGNPDVLGKNLLIDNKKLYVVTGILPNMPANSFLRNHEVFLSLTSYKDESTVAWNTWYFPTFVKLKPGTTAADMQVFLNTVKDKYLIPWAMTFVPGLTVENARAQEEKTGDYMRFNSTALTDIHLHSGNRNGEFSQNSDIENVYIMAIIGVFLIVLAAVNFMNLSTAHSLTRAKEVGIRKTLGSNRSSLIRQFLTESSMIALFSLALAIIIVLVVMPLFNHLTDKHMMIPFHNPAFWLVLLAGTSLLGIISGWYPAFFMSKFIPAKVLKGSHSSSVRGGTVRNTLVVFQFAISVFLIVCTLVVYKQISFIRHKDVGFRKDQVLVLDNMYAVGNHVESFRHSVSRLSQVANVSLSSYLPTPSMRSGTTYFLEGAIARDQFKSEDAMIIQEWGIDYEYLSALDIGLVAGRNFDRQFGSDSSSMLINESAARLLNLKPAEAIGIRMTDDFQRPDKENMEYKTVIGVVKNFHFESMRNGIDGLIMVLAGKSNKMIIRLKSGNFEQAIAAIHTEWDKVAKGQPFEYYFLDDSFNDTYQAELKLGKVFGVFTLVSLIIACLGLFGLAAFSAEKRSKEIGIRKILGAGFGNLIYELSYNFLKLVVLALIVALPVSAYVMTQWLEEFTYRIDVDGWILALAATTAIVVALITVSYQSIRAAVVNPVKSLRSE